MLHISNIKDDSNDSLLVHIYPCPCIHSIVEDTKHLSLLICTEITIFNSKRLYLLVQLVQSDESLSGSTQSNHHYNLPAAVRVQGLPVIML